MEQDEKRERAEQRVKELKSFYSHVITYVVVMVVLFIIDSRDRGNWWFYWPLMGWGIAVVLHGFNTFTTGWEKRKIKRLVEKEEEEELEE